MDDIPVVNVGVDVWDFKPIDINEILGFVAAEVRKRNADQSGTES